MGALLRDLVLALGPRVVSLSGNGDVAAPGPPGNNCCGPASLVPAWGGEEPMVPCQPLSLGFCISSPGSQALLGTGSARSQHRGPCGSGSPALVWPQQVTGYGFDFLSPSKSDLASPPSTS